jgi:hypothetical protein
MELKIDKLAFENIVRETSLRTLRPFGRACGISDIVKRRSIRVWDLRSNS